MSRFVRWCKFNLVGAVGAVVQLGALSALNRLTRVHYLAATAAAIEMTLLHNFIWHLHYTWRDRRDGRKKVGKLLRFHLTNGLVSMVGNITLMRLMVGAGRLPVLAANGIAILVCSMVNFWLSETSPFAGKSIESTNANAET